jgi:hypothetical protein
VCGNFPRNQCFRRHLATRGRPCLERCGIHRSARRAVALSAAIGRDAALELQPAAVQGNACFAGIFLSEFGDPASE